MNTPQNSRGSYERDRGRNVGLWLPPEDYARLEQWGKDRHRKVANAARTIILERLAADEQADRDRAAARMLTPGDPGQDPLPLDDDYPDHNGPNWGQQ